MRDYFRETRRSIEAALDGYLPPAKTGPRQLYRAMRYCVFSGGKRIRPIITVEAALACGGTLKRALPGACAVELIHSYSLVHDDLPSMDDDDFRRGKPTCHKRFGEAIAILAGDGLLTLSFGIIASRMDPGPGVRAASELAEAAGSSGMVGGQALDIAIKKRDKSPEALQNINLLKTARLFEASARIGAISAGADNAKIRAMAIYGRELGKGFQMTDDILDDDGCAKLLGRGPASARAVNSIGKAKSALRIFGKRSARLVAIADQVLHRISR